ncbi:DUF1080 domain-containing protein, partial [Gemmatimonadota bacterium]
GKPQRAQNTLTQQEIDEGWKLLFDGKTLKGWQNCGAWKAEDGTITNIPPEYGKRTYCYLWTDKPYENYILSLDFKISREKCNGGIFIRTRNLGNIYTGFEIQVSDSYGKDELTYRDCGALYFTAAPGPNSVKPAGEWNNIVITSNDNIISIVNNGVQGANVDLNGFTTPGKNPDGTDHLFGKHVTLKDFHRVGYIGVQEHIKPIWYRNIKIKELD